MKAINGDFYFFYSHSRDIKGMPCEGGTAVLLCGCFAAPVDFKMV